MHREAGDRYSEANREASSHFSDYGFWKNACGKAMLHARSTVGIALNRDAPDRMLDVAGRSTRPYADRLSVDGHQINGVGHVISPGMTALDHDIGQPAPRDVAEGSGF